MFANVVLIISNHIIMQKTFHTFTVAIRRYGHHLVTLKTPNMSTNCIREYTYISLVLISGDLKIVGNMWEILPIFKRIAWVPVVVYYTSLWASEKCPFSCYLISFLNVRLKLVKTTWFNLTALLCYPTFAKWEYLVKCVLRRR